MKRLEGLESGSRLCLFDFVCVCDFCRREEKRREVCVFVKYEGKASAVLQNQNQNQHQQGHVGSSRFSSLCCPSPRASTHLSYQGSRRPTAPVFCTDSSQPTPASVLAIEPPGKRRPNLHLGLSPRPRGCGLSGTLSSVAIVVVCRGSTAGARGGWAVDSGGQVTLGGLLSL